MHDRLDLKLWRIHDGLFYSTLICYFYQGPVIFLWETRRNDNLNYDLFKEHLPFVCLPVFKALDQRNMLGWNFPVLTETEHIDTRTRSDRCKKIFIRGWSGRGATILNRLVGIDGKAVELCIDFLTARESNPDLYCRLL